MFLLSLLSVVRVIVSHIQKAMSLQLLAKKINLYKPKLSKEAMQDLKKYVQLLDADQVNDVLDALFTMGHSFDELQLK